jgi:hypothetical protein
MDTGTYHKVGALPAIGLFIAALAVLGNYYYLYFVSFEQGASEGGWQFSLLKVVGLLLTYPLLLSTRLRTTMIAQEFMLLMFFTLTLVIYIFKVLFLGGGDIMFLNTVLCAVPFLVFRLNGNIRRVVLFLECCLFILAMQVLADTVVYRTDMSLWENKAFIGGLGNPSSFGLLCNLFVGYLLFYRRRSITSSLYFATLAYGVFMTSSMLAFLMLCAVLAIWGVSRLSMAKLVAAMGIVLIALVAGEKLFSEHLGYKLQSARSVLDGSTDSQSASVSLRLAAHQEYAGQFAEHPFEALSYGFDSQPYIWYDSQVLTYLSSYGVFPSALFFLAVFGLAVRAMLASSPLSRFVAVSLMLFLVTFTTNRILDYYPIPLFLFLLTATLRQITPPLSVNVPAAGTAP